MSYVASEGLPEDLRGNIAPHCRAIAAWKKLFGDHYREKLPSLIYDGMKVQDDEAEDVESQYNDIREEIITESSDVVTKIKTPAHERYCRSLPIFSAKLAACIILSCQNGQDLFVYFDTLQDKLSNYFDIFEEKSPSTALQFGLGTESIAKMEENIEKELDLLFAQMSSERRTAVIEKIRDYHHYDWRSHTKT